MEFTIKSFFKKFYKKIVIKIFQIIYGKPKLLKKKNKDKTIEEFQISFDKISYKIFKLSNGAVYTDSNDTTAYISENKYLSSASMQYYKVDNINSFNGSLSENETLSFGTPKI